MQNNFQQLITIHASCGLSHRKHAQINTTHFRKSY